MVAVYVSFKKDMIMSAFDIIVIGSGCGASPAAANFSRAGMKVCVLERGTWWGKFQGKIPFPENGLQFLKAARGLGISLPFIKRYLSLNIREGLFEYYLFNGYLSIAPCGVGGGSILYRRIYGYATRRSLDSLSERNNAGDHGKTLCNY